MKKNLFCIWLAMLAMLLSVNTQAQMTVGGKKEPEAFSVLELLNKGGLRLPQMTTAERNAFAVKNNDKGNGLTIYNKTTNCVEYWNAVRWVSLCEGTSQTTISPEPCVNVSADGTGCDSTFTIDDVDCPNGPFNIAIVAGGDYADLIDLDNVNGTFKIAFRPNETVNTHTVLVRVTSTCTSLYKEFLFSQNGIDCNSMSYTPPSITASTTALCTGGAAYLSVPANTANLDKLIWTRNGIEVARGVNYYVATQKGKYNISMGAVGCNTNAANEKNITESGAVTPVNLSAIASNNGVICGTNGVTLSATGSSATIAWFHNGKQETTGPTITISGDSAVGEWFAATKDGNCYSKPSNSITVTKSEATGQVSVPASSVLVNGVPLNTFTAFCAGGTLDLSVSNKTAGITYTWYNGNDVIVSNPYIVPTSQTKMSLRMVATDNSGAKCPAEASVIEKDIINGSTPAQPNITGNATLCDGTADLTLVPAAAGTYTYTWYKDGVKMSETTPTITVTTPGVTYTGSVTNATGCTSTLATKVIAVNVSSLPKLTWVSNPTDATYGAKITLQTSIEFGPANEYTWTADNGATIIGSGASVTVQLPASGADNTPLKVTVFAENNCGKSTSIELDIPMKSACPTPIVTPQSALSQTVTAGSSATVSISATGTVTPTYQWYSNTSASNTGGTAITGASTASYLAPTTNGGTYYFYCIVTNGCDASKKATSPAFTVVAEVNPATLPVGAGNLNGKTCFDIAESNDNTTCGTISSRQSGRSDFNLTAANTQTYTFTPVGTVSKVRFKYVESLSGAIVKTLTNDGDESANNISGNVTATVVYKNTLSSGGGLQGAAFGKTTESALSVDIYVIYNNKADGSGVDMQIKLRAQIKDCACCGAMVSPTVWKEFMCHNLGANTNLNAFIPNPGLVGDYYFWGASTPAGAYNGAGNAWMDNSIKTANDPCPAGYRVPTIAEWQGVIAYNVKTTLGTGSLGNGGYLFGKTLLLPNDALLNAGRVTPQFPATAGLTYFASDSRAALYSPNLAITYGSLSVQGFADTTTKTSIRCISTN